MSTAMLGVRGFVLVVVVVINFISMVASELPYACPTGWYTNNGYCYKFEMDAAATYDDARARCSLHGAGVLGVDTLSENAYISGWIATHDSYQQEWYTSGVRDTSDQARYGTGFIWQSNGQPLDVSLTSLWLDAPSDDLDNRVIVYSYGKDGVGWRLGDPHEERLYICKISEAEAYRILLTDRGYDYGLADYDPNNLETGPHFILQPHSVVVVNEEGRWTEPAVLDCVVQANPPAVYSWFRGENFHQEVTMELDNRYTLTNGKLTIEDPRENKDAATYVCVAENKFGKVLSDHVFISFGALGEFNNVPNAVTRAKAYEGAAVECSDIMYQPAVTYQWLKGSSMHFVRPQFQEYIFISRNGKLFFSEVTTADQEEYQCLAMLTGVNRYTIGTDQPPVRASLPIPLIVEDQAPKAPWGPIIQDDFIAVFPSPPLRGYDLRMECFAYGSSNSKFVYRWSREDRPMPSNVELQDHNRVLILKNAQLEDSGRYSCTVSRGTQARDTKTLNLELAARPYFVSPLGDQHVDLDAQLTWICNARGLPEPTYRWYKDGQLLRTDDSKRMRVQKNVLVIQQLEKKLHDGMYQCEASNTHGVSLSEAQLRVLALPPSINKYPPPPQVTASRTGNVTLRCQPEGAPLPTLEWLKNQSPITSDQVKYTIYVNGNLHITNLELADRGTYTCRATNIFGQAEVSSLLDITDGVRLTLPPSDNTIVVNETAFLQCQASYPQGVDMVYEWTFNNFPIDFRESAFSLKADEGSGTTGLYILAAQSKHEGRYTCTARTAFNQESGNAYLTVKGPPNQPAGVFVLGETVTHSSATVSWVAGHGNGGVVSLHVLQVANEFEPEVWEDKANVPVSESVVMDGTVTAKHQYQLTGLNPGTGYSFRIVAVNEYGRGHVSDPSPFIQTVSAAPTAIPQNLRGGGGSVGDLTIMWDALKRSEYGSSSVGYRVFWRPQPRGSEDPAWGLLTAPSATQDKVVELVGAEYYFLPYQAKIQAYNDKGFGPNSTVVTVYSAEDIPIGVPENVNTATFNSTAIEVFWDPVPDNRLYVRGRIMGYQINYWYEDEGTSSSQSINYYGQTDTGMVIGLDVDVNVIMDIQVYNSAGLGPRSNQYIMETSGFAPLNYPHEVRISSAGPNRAHLWWRGITISTSEEALSGYAIWLWTASEDARTAELIEIEGIVFEFTLDNIEDNRLYALRLAAVGGGGYGRKTPTIYFTMEGQILIDYNLAQTIDLFISPGARPQTSLTLLLLSFVLSGILKNFVR